MSALIHHRKTVHAGRVFRVDVEDVTLENGVRTAMDILRHPGAAAIVPLLPNGDVVLLRQYRLALDGYIWEIPAGTRDPGEAPLACARRELEEETGFSAEKWLRLNEIAPAPGYSDERIAIFLATELTVSTQKLDADELLAVHNVPFADAIAMIHSGEIVDGKTIAGLYMAARLLNTVKQAAPSSATSDKAGE